jgi:hypothetical protein
MKKYITTGCRPVQADNMKEAAQIFADRMARKKYGKGGYARTCNLESHSQDGTLGEYNAFLGYTPAGKHNQGSTVGSNERFSVYLVQPGEGIDYVRSVLAGKVAANVMDGDLEPPAGATCRTRSGFRAWLKRQEAAK